MSFRRLLAVAESIRNLDVKKMTEKQKTTPPRLETPHWAALPPDTPQQRQRFAQMVVLNDARFQTLVAKLPDAEINQVVLHVSAKGINTEEEKKRFAASNIVLSRIFNRICNTCLNKSDLNSLLACSRCHMTFYCSEKCQLADWDVHETWCCKKDGPIDKGPLRVLMIKTK